MRLWYVSCYIIQHRSAMTEFDCVEMEKIQMISQQKNDNVSDGAKEYPEIAEDLAISVQSRMPLGSEAVSDHSESILDAVVTDSPMPAKSRRTPALKVKELHHPVGIGTDDVLPAMHPVQVSHLAKPAPSSIREFIGGLSHCYNNLLMGIWGNATLIGMVLEKSDPFQSWLAELEDLIQNGSNLIHLLFGYIAERRSVARKLRLKQLRIELDAYRKTCGVGNAFSIIEDCIYEVSHTTTRIQLSANLARVIDQMQFLLQQKRSLIDEKTFRSTKAAAHLKKIDALFNRGTRLIIKLQYYAGVRIPVKKSVCLGSVVQRKVDEALGRKPHLRLTWKDAVPMPCIDADLNQIEYAVDQMLNNAIQAISEDGTIDIDFQTLYSEAPQDRCGVHMLRDYAVLTIRDTGKGMSTPFQSKIFEPFFTGVKGQGRSGLGLAAATGIIRAHGGYIQVRSKVGKGSSFKIYLPVR